MGDNRERNDVKSTSDYKEIINNLNTEIKTVIDRFVKKHNIPLLKEVYQPFVLEETVEYTLRDKDGKIKQQGTIGNKIK